MTWNRRAVPNSIIVAAIAFAPACGGDGDKEPTGNTGSIQVAVSPSGISVQQGGNGSVTVSLTRGGGFNGAVTLAVTGFPTGITATVTPAQLSGTVISATVSTTVVAAVAAGTYTGTVTATARGVSQATATYQVTVTAPAAGTDIEYRYCDVSQTPAFFAYQDGTGGWQRVTGSTAAGITKFAFRLTQGRGGVLAVYQSSSSAVASALQVRPTASARLTLARSLHTRETIRARTGRAGGTARALDRSSLADVYETDVLYASAAQLVQDGIDNCALSQPTKTVTGTVAGVSADQYGILSLGGASELFIGGTTMNPVTFTDVPVGPVDLIATRMTSAGTPPDKAFVIRDLNIPDGGSLPSTIDFNGPAVVPATASATVTGAAGDDLEIFTELVTTRHRLLMWFDLAPSAATTRPWAGIPDAAMANGEFHSLVVFASPRGSSDFRVSLKYVGSVANQALALGPTINLPAASQAAAGPYPRFRFQGGFPADYGKGASIDVTSTREEGNAYSIIATTAYLTGAGSAVAYDFTMPDVSGLPGFPAAARLTTGINEVLASAFGFTGPGIFDLQANLGSDFRAAARSFTITVP